MQQLTITIYSDFIELNKLLKFESLVESGGQAKVLIAQGLIKHNGQVVTQTRKKIYPGDTIEFQKVRYLIESMPG